LLLLKIGMTRGVLPLLEAHGAQAISVGVNGDSCPPAVPKAFVWKDNPTGANLIALWRITISFYYFYIHFIMLLIKKRQWWVSQ
jgi:hypothetical protein